MSFMNINTKRDSERGFTIVELLIVIVVIAILAAITIVSYNGITSRANTSGAQAAANSVVKKIEAYNAEEGGYPATTGLLTSAAATKSYQLTGVTVKNAAFSTQPSTADGPSTVYIQKCGTGTNQAVITGMRVYYWKYDGTAAIQNIDTGVISGTGVTCAVAAA